MQRLRGLVLIGNTLLPATLLISVASVFLYYKADVERGWAKTAAALDMIIAAADQIEGEVQGAVDKTKTDYTRAVENFKAVKEQFDQTYKDVSKPFDAVEALTMSTITVGKTSKTFTVPDPGNLNQRKTITISIPTVDQKTSAVGRALIKPFKDAFGVVNAAAQPFSDLVTGVDDDLAVLLKEMPEEARKAQIQTAIIARQARSVATPLGNMLNAIGYIAIALIVWFALSYVTWAHEWLVRGWALLRGKPG
jgi:hypothetical protein